MLSRSITSLAAGLSLTLLALSPAYALDLDIGIKIGDKSPERVEPHKNGPPDHAPAHGYRARHSYHYYPASEVYFDAGSGVFFYLSGNDWQMSAKLPLSLKARLGDHVTIEMDSDKPYTEYKAHKAKYPPGQAKHKPEHGHGNGRGHKDKHP